ncbi:hypothetical protein QBC38DRAFT_494047 [Podospora fimiseda]|uniref:Uncharacterized protein n=1 Tax=Podospora fimiseda TaxID=252190 RepID=A0AAN6YQK7_9PEZI|nr:hypothetical protein QBC38DRAFT_494047 [Podospora fimiseda]
MCPQDPKCPIPYAHGRGKAHQPKTKRNPAAISKPQSRRNSSRVNRTKLQEATLKSSRMWHLSAAFRDHNNRLAHKISELGPSDKFSDDLDLVRDLLSRWICGFADYDIWTPLLALLEQGLPEPATTTSTTPVWSSEEANLIEAWLAKPATTIVLHPIWNRFPDPNKIRKLMADVIIGPSTQAHAELLVTMLLSYGADITYTSGGQSHFSAIDVAVRGVTDTRYYQSRMADMLFLLMNNPEGSRQMQTSVPQETFEKISTFWSSEKGRTEMYRIIRLWREREEQFAEGSNSAYQWISQLLHYTRST